MKEASKYRFNYIIYQLTVMFFPYIPLFLKDAGYESSVYGAVMALTPFIIALALPLCSLLDRGSLGRKILVVLLCLVIIGAEWLMVFRSDYLSFVIISVLLASVARAPINTSIDNLTTVYCVETKQDFGKFRSFSSLGYIIANLLGAFLYQKTGFIPILVASSVAGLIYIFSWSATKPLKLDALRDKKEPNYRILFRNKAFLLFIVYQILCFTAFTFNNNYDILYQNTRELPSVMFGVFTAIRVGMEILTYLVLMKIKIPYKVMLVLAPIFLIVPAFFYYLMVDTFYIYFLIAVSGVGGGLLIYPTNKYLISVVRPRNVTVALYITAIMQNLFVGIFTLIGGFALETVHIKYLYLGSSAVLAAALLFSVILPNERKIKQEINPV